MAVFGPNQREELLIGNAVASETTVSTFISSASNQELGVFSKDGTDVASGEKFYVLQKTNGPANVGLNYEFSDVVEPDKVNKVTLKAYQAEVQRVVTVTGFTGTPQANATYEVLIRLYDDGGALSTENFRIISGFYVTDSSTVSNQTIIDGIITDLRRGQQLEGDDLFTFANVGNNSITITSKRQVGDPAKDIADPIRFDVQVAVKSNGVDPATSSPTVYNLLTATVTTAGSPGAGTGKYVSNLEWFTRGYKYEAYRQTGYPADFSQPALYANYDGAYNMIHISYYSKNSVAGVEEQPKVLSLAVQFTPGTVSTNAATNAVLAKLRTVLGSSNVPADLATS